MAEDNFELNELEGAAENADADEGGGGTVAAMDGLPDIGDLPRSAKDLVIRI